ncbi:proteasome assembly chaperone 4 [Benincasa hispida]|uniref:proteasome assembly chaperone 4 n=1 Tax=Benincasa hispida TaxID=102211 RepID=UPI0019017371|nr:proteasome assembly chaperone 4 [Benincasa hispida]
MLYQGQISKEEQPVSSPSISNNDDNLDGGGVQVTCFSEAINDVPIHFQIICLSKQIYVWIGCNSAKIGNLYAAAPTRPNNTVSVTSILGGSSDNTGSSMARRLVLKSGLNIILASNIPKNSPMIEVAAEKILVQKLVTLGYIRPKSEGPSR